MPLTRVSLMRGKSSAYKENIAESVYQALMEEFDVPKDDKFVVINEHDHDTFYYGENYLGLKKTDDLVIIQIFINNTRTVEQKKKLYQAITEKLHQSIGIEKSNLLISLVDVGDVGNENWSFGEGIAQYLL